MSKSLSVCSSFRRKSKSSLNGFSQVTLKLASILLDTPLDHLMANPSPNIDDFGAIDDFYHNEDKYFLFLITLPVKLFQSLHVGDMNLP